VYVRMCVSEGVCVCVFLESESVFKHVCVCVCVCVGVNVSACILFSSGCHIQFAGSHFFEGSQFSVSGLSLAFYSGLYAYDGWYLFSVFVVVYILCKLLLIHVLSYCMCVCLNI